MKSISKYLFLGAIGFFGYLLLEIFYRGYTYWLMGVAGMTAFLLIGLLRKILPYNTPLLIQMILASCIVTYIELTMGSILLVFNTRMWNYSNHLYNFKGLICPYFSFMWSFVGLFAIFLNDYLRYKFFGENKPHYRFL